MWSPDGSRIAVTAEVHRQAPDEPVVVDRLGKVDGQGMRGTARTQLFVVETASGRVTRLTLGDFHVTGTPSWSPDGTRLAFPAVAGRDYDLTGAVAAHVVDAFGPSPLPTPVGPAAGPVRAVAWHPGGDTLLLTGRTAHGAGHESLRLQPLDGSAPTALAVGLDRNVMPGGSGYPGALPQFHGSKGESVVFCARDRGATRPYRLPLDDGPGLGSAAAVELPLPAGSGVSGCSVAAGKAALAVADGASYGEIALLDLETGALARLTAHMAGALPEVTLAPVTEREFAISDGTRVHGLVTRDPRAP
ncbi:serine hydrolase, partial [Streptomyces hydrogenans]|uniref:TolB family protein n=1 Tax=Streptomyces hydrogenans TaxID=1873719 RepID=UPI00348961D9